MKRGLNAKEKATLLSIKNAGYSYEVIEMFNYKGEPEYYANANGWCISLSYPGEWNESMKIGDKIRDIEDGDCYLKE